MLNVENAKLKINFKHKSTFISVQFWLLLTTYKVGQKNVALYFCQYLRQLLTDFQNSFTGTLCRQFAITRLLHIPPQRKCVSTLSCEILLKYAYITMITNKHFGKIKKKLQTNIAVNGLYVHSLECHTDHSSQCWSKMIF